MSSKGLRKTKDPCPRCRIHRERCICAAIPSLQFKTRVSLLIHAREITRASNSGRLAIEALVNSQMRIKGERTGAVNLSDWLDPEFDNVLLYPSDDAIDLCDFKATKPVNLIVSDGNWRQAAKINTRHPELAHIPRVKISEINTAVFHLRRESRPEGMSTLEAIAKALGILEGAVQVEPLMNLYKAKLRATIVGRGQVFTEALAPSP